ncbi:MAG TPA: ubiquitin-activating E1 FCCH domain-containing protein, partial [Candidatus Cloacimonadota bacterium]|nr:ubiquitin-activating E1 FCCH domain-containing protein [Candidatus Cloacimonadota bacterium]
MSNNHILTKKIGNLRGISTDSLYLRPANVASEAKNIQRAPDGTLQIRRGYQCQIANIGGLGIGSFDNPSEDTVLTCCIGLDGFLYNKLTRQIFMNYDGRITGAISNVTNPSADLTNIVSNSHGLQTGAQVIIRNVGGATQLNNPSTFSMVSYNFYSITVTDANNFILDGIPFSQLSAYTSGGTWSVAFADRRYLTFSIYVDPQFIYAISNQSINAKVIENRAAQVNGNQLNVNIIQVQYGSSFSVGN